MPCSNQGRINLIQCNGHQDPPLCKRNLCAVKISFGKQMFLYFQVETGGMEIGWAHCKWLLADTCPWKSSLAHIYTFTHILARFLFPTKQATDLIFVLIPCLLKYFFGSGGFHYSDERIYHKQSGFSRLFKYFLSNINLLRKNLERWKSWCKTEEEWWLSFLFGHSHSPRALSKQIQRFLTETRHLLKSTQPAWLSWIQTFQHKYIFKDLLLIPPKFDNL